MRRNAIIEYADVSNFSQPVIEPVTVEEFKNYARLQGFEEDNESGEFTFDSDDAFIAQLITASRMAIEEITGKSLVAHEWKAVIENGYGQVLPFSNGAEITEVIDADGKDITSSITTQGIDFKRISGNCGQLTVSYSTDGDCPAALKTAILVDVLWRYENRGDSSISKQAQQIAVLHKAPYSWLQ